MFFVALCVLSIFAETKDGIDAGLMHANQMREAFRYARMQRQQSRGGMRERHGLSTNAEEATAGAEDTCMADCQKLEDVDEDVCTAACKGSKEKCVSGLTEYLSQNTPDEEDTKFKVTWEAVTGAKIDVKNGQNAVTSGDSVAAGTALTITVTPDAGKTVSSVKVNGATLTNTKEDGTYVYSYTVTEAATIAVTVADASAGGATYTVTWTAVDGASIAVKNGQNAVNSGDSVDAGTTLTITVTATDGKTIKAVKVNTETQTNTGSEGTYVYSYTVNAAVTSITVEFEEETQTETDYTVSWTEATDVFTALTATVAGTDATITTASFKAKEGQEVAVTVTPTESKVITLTAAGSVTGTWDGENGKYTFTFEMPGEDVTLTIAVAQTHTLTLDKTGLSTASATVTVTYTLNGRASEEETVTDTLAVPSGASVTVKVAASNGGVAIAADPEITGLVDTVTDGQTESVATFTMSAAQKLTLTDKTESRVNGDEEEEESEEGSEEAAIEELCAQLYPESSDGEASSSSDPSSSSSSDSTSSSSSDSTSSSDYPTDISSETCSEAGLKELEEAYGKDYGSYVGWSKQMCACVDKAEKMEEVAKCAMQSHGYTVVKTPNEDGGFGYVTFTGKAKINDVKFGDKDNGINAMGTTLVVTNCKFTSVTSIENPYVPSDDTACISIDPAYDLEDQEKIVSAGYLGVSDCTFSKCTTDYAIVSYTETAIRYCVFNECENSKHVIKLASDSDCSVSNCNFTSCKGPYPGVAISAYMTGKLTVARCYFYKLSSSMAPVSISVLIKEEGSKSNAGSKGSFVLTGSAFEGNSLTSVTPSAATAVVDVQIKPDAHVELKEEDYSVSDCYTDQQLAAAIFYVDQTPVTKGVETAEKPAEKAEVSKDAGFGLKDVSDPDDDDDGFPVWAIVLIVVVAVAIIAAVVVVVILVVHKNQKVSPNGQGEAKSVEVDTVADSGEN